MVDLLDRARTAVGDRAELPGMSLLEHLQELRKRLVYSLLSIGVGFFVAYGFHQRIAAFMIAPITKALNAHHLNTQLVYLNPMDPFQFLPEDWIVRRHHRRLAIHSVPGLAVHRARPLSKRKALSDSLHVRDGGLVPAGAFFGYRFVYPGALEFLIGYGSQFKPMVTIGEYTELFLTVILGLGIVFELPILVFFLALFGIVNSRWLWKNIRYAILVIFIIAGIITPRPTR